MTLTITQRDKKLLSVVSCALILVVWFQYLFVPALNKRAELELKLQELTYQKEEWEFQIAQLPSMEKSIEGNKAARDKASAPYYGALETREMDEIITDLVLKHELFPRSLTLQEPKPGTVTDYLYYTPATQRNLEPRGYVHIGTASMTLEGSTENWEQLLDDVLAHYPGLRVTDFSVSENSYVRAGGRVVQTAVMRCSMEIYMCIPGEEAAK